MRITNSMMIANTVRNINSSARRLNEAQERISSEKNISLPSDDPVIATRSIKYRNYVARIEQFQKNAEDAASWQEVTEGALDTLNDVITQVRTLTVKAAGGTLTDSDLTDIKTEIAELRDQAIEIMNTAYGDRYVFAGFNTAEPPYALESTTVGDTAAFKGGWLSLCGVVPSSVADADISACYAAEAANSYTTASAHSIKYNIGFDNEVTVNIEGQDVVGEGAGNLFDTFAKLLLALDGETSYKTYDAGSGMVTTAAIDGIDDLLDDLDVNREKITTIQATLGARMNYVNSVAERLGNDYTTYTTLMSQNEDVDISTATMEEATAQTVYQASLSVGAKAITKTLVDYMA
ncbi:MAG: flagellar hook-associated protein FlgL [Sporomusaceae bacterium]|nr:flagellar hook-associated protein FlgL [Sporomusaceae bacterium]